MRINATNIASGFQTRIFGNEQLRSDKYANDPLRHDIRRQIAGQSAPQTRTVNDVATFENHSLASKAEGRQPFWTIGLVKSRIALRRWRVLLVSVAKSTNFSKSGRGIGRIESCIRKPEESVKMVVPQRGPTFTKAAKQVLSKK